MALLYPSSTTTPPIAIVLIVVLFCCEALATPANCIVNGTLGEDDCGMDSTCQNGLCRCDLNFFTPSGTHTDCRNSEEPDAMCEDYSPECVYCGARHEGPCIKCVNVITEDGQCYDSCPTGTQLTVLNLAGINLSVRKCTGSTVPVWVIVVGVVFGTLFLVLVTIVVVLAAYCIRKKRQAQHREFLENLINQLTDENEDNPENNNLFDHLDRH